MQDPYVSFGADVPFHIVEPYGIDRDSLELPKESTKAHIRIINYDLDSLQVFIDVEGTPLMLFYLPKDVGISTQFRGVFLMQHDQLMNILQGQDELVNRLKESTDKEDVATDSQASHS